MNKMTLVTAIAASVLSFSANAENFYVEASVGTTDVAEESGTSAGLLGGYTFFNKSQIQVSAEAGFNLYSHKETETALGTVTQDISSLSVGTKVNYSPMAKLGLFGRLAYEQLTVKFEHDLLGSNSESSNEITYALGASYEVAENFELGSQYKYASLSDTDLNSLSLTANYKF
jgi:outer membrane autotransporter protein